MSTPTEDVAQHIAGMGLGLAIGTDLFQAIMPEKPSDAVSVMPQGGGDPDMTLDSQAPRHDNVRLSVWVRRSSWAAAESLAWTFYYRLSLSNADVNGNPYLSIRPAGPPFLLSRDRHERVIASVNFAVKRPTPDLS